MALSQFGMTAAVVTIGDEVVEGRVANENAAWISGQLMERGLWPRLVIAIPDDEDLIVRTLRMAWDSADIVIVSGGLGFTPDDITRRAVARACLRDAVIDEHVSRTVLDTLDWVDAETARAVSSFPEGAKPILSPCGGVPGFSVGDLHVLPGSPREMRAMFATIPLPEGADQDITTTHLNCRTTEDAIQSVLVEFDEHFHDVRLGSYPDYSQHEPSVNIVLVSRSVESLESADEWLSRTWNCATTH
ncbi:MAG: competence/damage-inducible protein A [Actinobacteria bacterium]|nr:competence/damage-inducible protein A [Actinomycetota bacterium]